ncbi:MAG: ParB/RepB/Spo0J family partition protein [Burkholderiaceae bacterium]|nr:ParB/RepB/Spo0J family partition protein [Burkholderiaceae bacterium]
MRFDLDAIDAPAEPAGTPRLIALADIDEDPQQPRVEFDDESLAELTATIAERGVKQPVSVRPHPSDPGRWLLNFGARRLRASKLAGKDSIPAFVDEAFDSYDQVIENEQREGLKPLELALFVQRRLALGESQAEIARRLGKSKTLITMIGALIDAPPWLLEVYRSGRCQGINELYELRRLHESDPPAVERWVANREKVSRAEVQAYKADASRSGDREPTPPAAAGSVLEGAAGGQIFSERRRVAPSAASALRQRGDSPGRVLHLHGRVAGEAVRVLLDEPPLEAAHATVELIGSSERRVVPLSGLEALRIVEVSR